MNTPAKNRIVVTGGSGFIGTNLVDHLTNEGWRVLNLDIKQPLDPEQMRYWQRVDILDRQELIKAVNAFSPAALINLAAKTDIDETGSLEDYAVNTKGVSNIIDCVNQNRSIRRSIFCSTQLVCRIGYRPSRDTDYCPNTLYGRSKVQGEQFVRKAVFKHSTWTIIRPTSIWGTWFGVPYRNFFETIRKGWYFHPGRTGARKQWGYIGNAVYEIAGLLDAEKEWIDGQTFYIADFEPLRLDEFADLVQQQFRKSKIRRLPDWLFRLAGKTGDLLTLSGLKNFPMTSFRYRNMITDELQDIEPLKKIIGELPFSVHEGISATAQWMQAADNFEGVE